MHKVFVDLIYFLAKDERATKEFCNDFNEFLDALLCHDFFGTEGQCDPRGDHRN